MLSKAVQDRYRCPESFLDFGLDGIMSRDPGYFQFGRDTTGYGRVSTGVTPSQVESTADLFSRVVIEKTQVRLPFDPDDVIDNLRLERYASGQWGASERALKKFYYWIRPLTSLGLRKRIKMFYS